MTTTFFLRLFGLQITCCFCLLAFTIQAQAPTLDCASDFLHRQKVAEDAVFKNKTVSLEKKWAKQEWRGLLTAAYTLPVVVHVVHQNGPENISDSQINSAIDQLNAAFSNTGYYDPTNGVDVELAFCLARQDPQGNPSTGIDRTISNLTDVNLATEDLSLKNLLRWDPLRYINIWVVREVCSPTGCSVAGYAYFPSAHGEPFDGIVVEAAYMGSSPENTTVLVHEMGHYLGLYHTFEGGCANNDCLTQGDRVCDTPPDQTTTPAPCNATVNSCTSDSDDATTNNPFRSTALGGLGDQPDLFSNYMDYSELSCYNQFTQGQKERIHFFVENARMSLLWSPGCSNPCSQPVSADFNAGAGPFLVGQAISFQNLSQHASDYIWYQDGLPVSTDPSPVLTFGQPGQYYIVLQANPTDKGCLPDFDTLLLDLKCPTQADFNLNVQNLQVQTTNNSLNGLAYDWSVQQLNGVELFHFTTPSPSWTFPGAGWYRICLQAQGAECTDEKCLEIQVFVSGSEQCNNGIDDDGDGLIDAFDTDCPCSVEGYQTQCPVECQALPNPNTAFDMHLAWQTDTIVGACPTMTVGDVDADGQVEIVCQGNNNRIIIVNGKTGQLERSISCPGAKYEATPLAIADVDGDGRAEIFIPVAISSTAQKIRCYKQSGNLLWQSPVINIPSFPEEGSCVHVNVADFNGDGTPEVYASNYIFNAKTGALLAKGNAATGATYPDPYSYGRYSVAGDFLPDAGLELAAGNTVYKVTLTNPAGMAGNTMTAFSLAAVPVYGFVGFADFDDDGRPEMVSIADGGNVYIWNPRTLTILASYTQLELRASAPTLADLDGDCIPEIIYQVELKIFVFKYTGAPQLQLKYVKPTSDDSAFTGIAAFDFNADGKLELVFRDETFLHVMDGNTGVDLAVYPVSSRTAYEMPIIADLNQDGSAEILTNGNGEMDIWSESSRLLVFRSNGAPWAPARGVWNQPAYSVTNVNDDLSIPRTPQNPAVLIPGTEHCTSATCPRVYNSYSQQATLRTQNGCIQIPSADAQPELLSVNCVQGGLEISFRVKNLGQLVALPGQMGLAVYDKNPLSGPAALLNFTTLGASLSGLSSSPQLTIDLPLSAASGSVFLVLNAIPGATTPFVFPLSSFSECDYSNNLLEIPYDFPMPMLDLGPDLVVCENQAVVLHAGTGFQQYQWSNGGTDENATVFGAGNHWVKATDACGREQIDEVLISIDPASKPDLGADRVICSGTATILSPGSQFISYQWSPVGAVDCADCPEVQFTASQTTQLWVLTQSGAGCFSADSILIQVLPEQVQVQLQTAFCEGDSIRLGNQWVYDSGIYDYQNSALPCDTLFHAQVLLLDTSVQQLSYLLCPNETIQVAGNAISIPGNYSFRLTNAKGCDSTLQVLVLPADTAMAPVLEADCDAWTVNASVTVPDQWQLHWSNGDTALQTHFLNAGPASLDVSTDAGCVQQFNFIVPTFPDTSILPQFKDTLVPAGTVYNLGVTLPATEWLLEWQPPAFFSCAGCPQTSVVRQEDTILTAVFTHLGTGCVFRRDFSIRWIASDALYIPNVFAPGSNSGNSKWEVFLQPQVERILDARIYDRWGSEVFAVQNVGQLQWDGRVNGRKAQSGVYVYWMRYRLKDGTEGFKKGDLTLMD